MSSYFTERIQNNSENALAKKPEKTLLLTLLAPAAARWEEIGNGLKVSRKTIEYIQLSNKRPISNLSVVLQVWMSTLSSPVTWKNIIQVVQSSDVDRKDIAEDMKFAAQHEN